MNPIDVKDLILVGIGVFISLVFSYFPAVSKWFYKLNYNIRGLVMVGLSAAATLIVYALSCWNWLSIVSCDQAGIQVLVSAFIKVLLANQVTYMVSPESPTKTKMINDYIDSCSTPLNVIGFPLPKTEEDDDEEDLTGSQG